ncbi:tRNA(Ile)-lysidine synthase [Sphingomonas sp. DBB INV C78]|uniref:tRNA lysidine(34) synthetase TilS n=1 Tax=Sphingomonas sp. DBB INV C78 TaxID=3349434 RepID=UPI0036D3BA8F
MPSLPLDRFRTDLVALTGDPAARIGVAVSGGPDSLALLLLAHAALPGMIAAATVDHGLRREAADEAAFVAGLCSVRGIPHATLSVSVESAGEGIQAAARAARYAALEDWRSREGLDFIATAHHADDQAETLLMRASRSAGIGGLAGIRRRNGSVIRPLLDWRRAELAAIVADAGITAIDDPSNRDDRFDRSRIRALLNQADDLDAPGLAQTAANLADAAEALEWAAERLWSERATVTEKEVRLDPADLPPELLHRLVRRALAALGHQGRIDRVASLIARLSSGQPGTIGAILARPGAIWVFSPAPPRRIS